MKPTKEMQKDIRDTPLYGEAETLYRMLRQPGTGQICDASQVHVSPDGQRAVFAGTQMDSLEGVLKTRICQVDLDSGDTRVLTFGPNTDRLPKFSPDGRQIAFLSDRHKAGDFQLHFLDASTGAARAAAFVDGWVEYLHWSPDGTRILLGVAGHGADVAGGQGAVATKRAAEQLPSWMPMIEIGDEDYRWRRAWVYELATGRVRQVSKAETNVWEAVWSGNDSLAIVASPSPGEGVWYTARLYIVDVQSGEEREVYAPKDQLGYPAASPSGRRLSIVEAVCSDRWVVAGEIRLIDTASGKVRHLDTRGVDVSCAEWRSENHLLLAGHRGFETVVALYDASSETLTEVWASNELTTGGFLVSVAGLGADGDGVLVGESYTRAPEIAAIRRGAYRAVRSFDLGYADHVSPLGTAERVSWSAPDGLEIQGWLLRPRGPGPHPLVMSIHGGPVYHWRPRWPGRNAIGVADLLLLKRGYAVFYPNPRGSSGRGQDFVRHVLGDMGGADTHDYLSGLDHLVARGIADPKRLGVTGGSYGGFMTSWLITQDSRFAAAVPIAPVINHVTEHLISNIPHFVKLFLADSYINPTGKYFQRSPLMHAHKAKTPTLNICGALDRCTPPEEAVQFHNALLENGVKSVLVIYPEEGHGVRKLPAAIDFVCRIVGWFETHIPTA